MLGTTTVLEKVIAIPKILPSILPLFYQEKTNWCWAAGTAYVSDCLSTYQTQCHVASTCITLCKSECTDHECNTPYYLEVSLRKFNHFHETTTGKIKLSEVRHEIEKNRPVGVRIQWQGGGGHIILIIGIGSSSQRPNVPRFAIFDPNPEVGLHILRASVLMQDRYMMTGSWSETFFTQ